MGPPAHGTPSGRQAGGSRRRGDLWVGELPHCLAFSIQAQDPGLWVNTGCGWVLAGSRGINVVSRGCLRGSGGFSPLALAAGRVRHGLRFYAKRQASSVAPLARKSTGDAGQSSSVDTRSPQRDKCNPRKVIRCFGHWGPVTRTLKFPGTKARYASFPPKAPFSSSLPANTPFRQPEPSFVGI